MTTRLETKPGPGKRAVSFVRPRKIFILLAALYALGAAPAAWNVVGHTSASTAAIEKILNLYSLRNEGAQALGRYNERHPLLGFFISSPIRHTLDLPSESESSKALYGDVLRLLRTVRQESHLAAWWSWLLINLSLVYAAAAILLERSLTTRPVLFALTCVNVVCFAVGIFAPAMVIWTAPTIPMETGNLSFVVQHEIRGIAAIIRELLTQGHWIIGGFLLLFSLVTPLAKASLTFFATASGAGTLNRRIGQFLHTIGKWSMADVCVAGVLLSLYALRFQQATRSIPCLGLYYFIGYCLLSLATTELLMHSGIVSDDPKAEARTRGKLGGRGIACLAAVVLAFFLGSGLFTYRQYTVNLREKIHPARSPERLNDAILVTPTHGRDPGK